MPLCRTNVGVITIVHRNRNLYCATLNNLAIIQAESTAYTWLGLSFENFLAGLLEIIRKEKKRLADIIQYELLRYTVGEILMCGFAVLK